jgi:predicted ester cyclase
MQTVRDAFPDFHNTIEELVAENQHVAARLTYHGTQRGEIFGVVPTGRRITYAGAAFFQITDGRITKGWVLGDRMSLLQQLGENFVADVAGAKVKK